MSDNRTTELRAKLTERGVDWTKPKSAAEFIQTTFLRDGWGIEVLERNIGLCVTATNVFDTPEQVIAATLGSERETELQDALNEVADKWARAQVEAEDYAKENLLLKAKLDAATHGTLTAEQVKRIHEIIEKHWHDLPDEYDMPEATALPEYSYDWQAIADELNAELGSGTCELTETDSYSNANEVVHVLECSACGETCEHVNGSYPRCPHCGRKVVSA